MYEIENKSWTKHPITSLNNLANPLENFNFYFKLEKQSISLKATLLCKLIKLKWFAEKKYVFSSIILGTYFLLPHFISFHYSFTPLLLVSPSPSLLALLSKRLSFSSFLQQNKCIYEHALLKKEKHYNEIKLFKIFDENDKSSNIKYKKRIAVIRKMRLE